MAHLVVASTKSDLKHARALDALGVRKTAGTASRVEYGPRRRQPLREIGRQHWHWDIPLAVILGVLLAALVLIRIIGVFRYAATGV